MGDLYVIKRFKFSWNSQEFNQESLDFQLPLINHYGSSFLAVNIK